MAKAYGSISDPNSKGKTIMSSGTDDNDDDDDNNITNDDLHDDDGIELEAEDTLGLLSSFQNSSSSSHSKARNDHMHNEEESASSQSLKEHHRKNSVVRKILAFSLASIALFVLLSHVIVVAHNNNNKNRESVNPMDIHIPVGSSSSLLGMQQHHQHHNNHRAPFSTKNPVADLGVPAFARPEGSSPSRVLHRSSAIPLPTNAWYQNLLMVDDQPSALHRAYATPYVVDCAGPVPGLRLHPNHITASSTVVQLNIVERYGLTLGINPKNANNKNNKTTTTSVDRRYVAGVMTSLSLTLQWNAATMISSIARGMPFASMRYDGMEHLLAQGQYPVIASETRVRGSVLVDRKTHWNCSQAELADAHAVWVHHELEFVLDESDFSWLVFFSEPVKVKCTVSNEGSTRISVVGLPNDAGLVDKNRPFYIRGALKTMCTTGRNPIYCLQKEMIPSALHIGQGDYGDLLRNNSFLLPGPHSNIRFNDTDESTSEIHFDWDAVDMRPSPTTNESAGELLMFTLPHHRETSGAPESPTEELYCAHSLIGAACLAKGSTWTFSEDLPEVSFRAPRPPAPWAVDSIASALATDLDFRLPAFFQRGAGDTYFSGKMLAKMARILLVFDELDELCGSINDDQPATDTYEGFYSQLSYQEACAKVDLDALKPSVKGSLDSLRDSVEVWLTQKAETPFVYDSAWRGIASCGCYFNGKRCKNKFPNCPAFYDAGLNFGNAFYNDQHFHYGYHIYAAAVIAKFDPTWGRKNFERVLLLVRSIANPSTSDSFFPLFRHKDWYQGHSWASGINIPPVMNGRNQESSSEAIAAYEAVALYGKIMAECFATHGDEDQSRAQNIESTGLVLLATELRSARRYWHTPIDSKKYTFPEEYTASAVGIMWQTMAQFQTWFGSASYMAYGIQLLPTTPISEYRDDQAWLESMYVPFNRSCTMDPGCEINGWSILETGMLASIGHENLALEMSMNLPMEAFDSAGGNGHSLANTLWFIATRPQISSPSPLHEGTPPKPSKNETFPEEFELVDCYQPDGCTDALDVIVDSYTCRQRIEYLMNVFQKTQRDACYQVAALEYPVVCGACNPYGKPDKKKEAQTESACPPCSEAECQSDLNRCPSYKRTFVCTSGKNRGGCRSGPWMLGRECTGCCELSTCEADVKTVKQVPTHEDDEDEDDSSCPSCPADVASINGNQCPTDSSAPYLCYAGQNSGGCSPRPWETGTDLCQKCCKLVF